MSHSHAMPASKPNGNFFLKIFKYLTNFLKLSFVNLTTSIAALISLILCCVFFVTTPILSNSINHLNVNNLNFWQIIVKIGSNFYILIYCFSMGFVGGSISLLLLSRSKKLKTDIWKVILELFFLSPFASFIAFIAIVVLFGTPSSILYLFLLLIAVGIVPRQFFKPLCQYAISFFRRILI